MKERNVNINIFLLIAFSILMATAYISADSDSDLLGQWNREGEAYNIRIDRDSDDQFSSRATGSLEWEATCNEIRTNVLRCSGSGQRKADRRRLNINMILKTIDEGTLQFRYSVAFAGGERERGDFLLRKKINPIDPEDVNTEEAIDTETEISYSGCPSGSEVVPATNAEFEREVFRLVNNVRRQNGLAELTWSQELTHASRYHAADMAIENYFDHTSFDRRGDGLVESCGTWERIGAFYNSPAAENIAAGSNTPQGVMRQWMNSPGHRANILSRSVKTLGVGLHSESDSRYGHYWVQNFGR